jgi:hypothetical protein
MKYKLIITLLLGILLISCNYSKKSKITTEEFLELANKNLERLDAERELKQKIFDFEMKVSKTIRQDPNLRHMWEGSDEFKNIVKPLIEEATQIYNLSHTDVKYIESNILYIGMPETLIFLTWGHPTDFRTTTTQSGKIVQYIYRSSIGGTKYAYTENGLLTAFQN